jgi:hypothetical protein
MPALRRFALIPAHFPRPARLRRTCRPSGSTWSRRAARPVLVAVGCAVVMVTAGTTAYAASSTGVRVLADPTVTGVIDNVRTWLLGILAAIATLFLTIGGVRYLIAGGNPAEVEKAKSAFKSAAIGYCLAILAPVVVTILQSIVGN